MRPESHKSAAELGLAGCHTCGKVSHIDEKHCPRCGAPLHLRKHNAVQTCVALVVTAIILYIPANVLPIMSTATFGSSEPSTILSGVVMLWEHGSAFIAIIILIASVVVPLAKMFMLLYICWVISRRKQTGQKDSTRLFVITEIIGRWSMIDVFVVGILLLA